MGGWALPCFANEDFRAYFFSDHGVDSIGFPTRRLRCFQNEFVSAIGGDGDVVGVVAG